MQVVWLGGGGYPGPHLGGVVQAHTQGGCILACTEADPPIRRLLLWAVRILLECILVLRCCRFSVSVPFIKFPRGGAGTAGNVPSSG